MIASKKWFWFYLLILFIYVLTPVCGPAVQAQEVTPQMIEQAKQAVAQGLISPEEAKKLQEKAAMGTLTPSEIETGKKLLEQRKTSTGTNAPTPVQNTAKPLAPVVVDTHPESTGTATAQAPPKSSGESEKGTAAEAPAQQEKDAQAQLTDFDDQYFKKSDGPQYPELPLFGHELFTSAPSTFAPIKDIPVSDNYIIGPDDQIKILTWGLMDSDYSLTVDREGMINLPKIGRLPVGGLTFGEVKKLIKGKLEAITGVKASVSMGALRSIQIMVLGEVKAPGIYTVSSLATVANALLTSGGPTRLGSLRNVQLKRNGKIIDRLDLYDFLLRGDVSSDSRLMPGDVIFVPQIGPLVMVSGNVKRPAAYELKNSRTLETALKLAGGLAPQAFNQRIQIERSFDNKAKVVLDISQNELAQKKRIPVRDGDLIRVFSILPKAENAVFLYGNVRRPGRYAYKKGIKLTDLLPDVDSLEKNSYFDYALIKRYRMKHMKAKLIPFDLGALILKHDQRQNISLKPLDEVYVFNKSMFQDKAFAQVQGEVRRPGTYPIQDMKVRDLILKAGDLTHEAYLRKGELIRVDAQRNRHTLYFDVGAAMRGDPKDNLELQNEDRVVIHSIWEDQWKPSVTISGEVKNPGKYTLTSGMRLSDLIFKAGNFTRDAYMGIGHLYRTDWRTRKKTILTFNLAKAMAGYPTQNLVLQDLDQVVIHNIDEYVNSYTVSIKGFVNKPGDYPYATNMTIRDLFIVAGNVRQAAYMDQAELVRFKIVGGKQVKTSIKKFNIRLALAGDPKNNLKLQPMDVVTVKEIPDWWDKKKSVTITGQVYFPGTYQIRKDEHISDIIQRAGGYTDYAYLYGAVFTRESVKVLQKKRLADLADRLENEIARSDSEQVQTSLSPGDVAAQSQFVSAQKELLKKLRSAQPTGRVVIALSRIKKSPGSSEDLVLDDGDTLYIPKKPSTVNVMGAVYNPTALAYDANHRTVRNYLSMTGGPTDDAQKDAMYVVQANGTVVSSKKTSWWRDFENTKLNPGDTVLVPQQVVHPSYMRDFKDITQILYQIATTAGVSAALF